MLVSGKEKNNEETKLSYECYNNPKLYNKYIFNRCK